MQPLEIFFIAVPILFGYLLLRRSKVRRNQLPPPPPEARGSWPLIGHLHLLAGPEPPHITLSKMSDRYGPIFTIRFGLNTVLVISSSEVAKECFTTHDKTFATRSKSVGSELLCYNNAISSLAPYGPYWRWARKTLTLELLSTHKLAKLASLRKSEIRASMKELQGLVREKGDNNVVEMKDWFKRTFLTLLLKIVAGKTYEDIAGQNTAFRDFSVLIGSFVVSDAIPFLRWLDIGGVEKAMKKTAGELDGVLQKWLVEHEERRSRDQLHGREEEEDFMDMLLALRDRGDQEFTAYDSSTFIKAQCLTVIIAGSDTTIVTLTWALSLMLNNKETLKKAQQELDIQVGKNREVNESDLNNLPYLQAIVKETLRLYPPLSLSLPHESTEDCNLAGYRVTKGTRLLVNLPKLHRDPHFWSHPEEFRPERFFTDQYRDIDVKGQNFELLPFGAGRRMCPGVSFAVPVSVLLLASLLHCFDIGADGPIDMTESGGLTNLKETPVEVHLTPRLGQDLYN